MRWKGSSIFYDELVRVPMIIANLSGETIQFKKGNSLEAPVELADIAPTILELTGQVIPEHMDGKKY